MKYNNKKREYLVNQESSAPFATYYVFILMIAFGEKGQTEEFIPRVLPSPDHYGHLNSLSLSLPPFYYPNGVGHCYSISEFNEEDTLFG